MIFATLPLDDAEGAILAHGLRLRNRKLAKGRVLDDGDLADLRAAGFAEVVAARLEAGDLGENEAARRAAAAIAGPRIEAAPPFTGRCNLYAGGEGLLCIDRARIDALNAIDEALTVATIAPDRPVGARPARRHGEGGSARPVPRFDRALERRDAAGLAADLGGAVPRFRRRAAAVAPRRHAPGDPRQDRAQRRSPPRRARRPAHARGTLRARGGGDRGRPRRAGGGPAATRWWWSGRRRSSTGATSCRARSSAPAARCCASACRSIPAI